MGLFRTKRCVAWLVAVSAILSLAACGGGGGSGDIQVVGSVSFSFPLPGGEVVGKTTTVTGMATGDVDEVLVNGQAATSDDGFRHWRATISLPQATTTVEIVGRAQGVEVGRATRSVRSQRVPMAHVDDVSREIGGVYVAWSDSVSAVTRVDRNTGQRSRIILDPGLGGATDYQIEDVEFDPGRNQAILFETSQGPQFITVSFDGSEVTSTPFPPAGGETLREIEYDDLGDRLILMTEVTPPIAVGTPHRIWTLHLGTWALNLISDENSPGAMNLLKFTAMSWEKTTGKLYAASMSGGGIVEISLVDGSRTVVFDHQLATGPFSYFTVGTLVAVANPLRFGVLRNYAYSDSSPPYLYDVATSTRVQITDGGPFPFTARSALQAADNDLRIIAAGRSIQRVNASGQFTLVEDFRINENFSAVVEWVHPTYDSKRRRLVGGGRTQLSYYDPETGITAQIPDEVPLLFGNPTYTDTAYYDAASDELIFASAFGISSIPASGGSRVQNQLVTYSLTGRPERSADDSGFWWGFRDFFGGNSRFKVTYYGDGGSATTTVDSPLAITQQHSYEFDFANDRVYCVGSDAGVNKVASFDLQTGVATYHGVDGDGGPSLGGTTSVLKIPGEDRLLVLTDHGLISVDLASNTRVMLDDFLQHPGLVAQLLGMTYDERDRILYLATYTPTRTLIAYEIESRTAQILAQ